MAVKVRHTTFPHRTLMTKKIEILADKQYRVKYDKDGTEHIILFNFDTFSEKVLSKGEIGHDDIVWRFRNKDTPEIHLTVYGSFTDYEAKEFEVSSYPHYFLFGTGETETAETQTATYTPAALTFAERRTRENNALIAWKKYMEEIMVEASAISFYSTTLLDNVRKMLKSMDQFIKNKSDTATIDPIVVARLIDEALKGPSGYTSFREQIIGMDTITFHATHAQSWVDVGPAENRLEITRRHLNNLVVGSSNNTLKDDYNPIDRSWITANREGSITIGNMSPVVGTEISAALYDSDSGVSNTEYQWQNRTGNDGTWVDITNATTARYTPVTADVGKQLRCTIRYTDNANTDTNNKNYLESLATNAVTSG